MKRKWAIKRVDESKIPAMPGYPPLVNLLLAQKGFSDPTAIHNYLHPDYSRLYDPFLFKDMAKAVARIKLAIQEKQKIVIYADYDADAITASTVMTLALRKLGGIVECYIPDRFTEGYGMNMEAMKKVAEEGAKLMITVDCGINSVQEAEICKSLGLDLIITDHHEITGELPDAYAVINPKNPDDNYPFKYLTGVGVAFKVVQALFKDETGDTPAGWEKWLLDIVSIGTVADLQSLEDENRILVYYGLQVLNKTRWPGVKALIEVSKMKLGKYTTHTLGFVLAPRINAAGRIKHADVAYKMLIAEDVSEAQTYALELDALNTHRQQLTERILSEAREQLLQHRDRKVLLAAGADWPKGVVGLVAGKLAEEFGKPVLIMDKGEEFATGSARSHPHFDMVKALIYSKDLLEKFGGHTQAAGYTLKSGNIELLYQRLLEFAETLNEADSEPTLELDAEITSEDFNWDNFDFIEKFEPFGFGNFKPKFAGHGLQIVEYRTVGADAQHLKMRLLWNGKVIDAIGFRFGYLAGKLDINSTVSVAFEMDANEWNGNRDLQMKIIDIKQGV